MTMKVSDALIDGIIASCDGDTRGALRALLLVNEQLEHELLQLQYAKAGPCKPRRGQGLLH